MNTRTKPTISEATLKKKAEREAQLVGLRALRDTWVGKDDAYVLKLERKIAALDSKQRRFSS